MKQSSVILLPFKGYKSKEQQTAGPAKRNKTKPSLIINKGYNENFRDICSHTLPQALLL